MNVHRLTDGNAERADGAEVRHLGRTPETLPATRHVGRHLYLQALIALLQSSATPNPGTTPWTPTKPSKR